MFSDKYLKPKMKSYNNKITTNFKNVKNNGAKPPKEGSKCIYPPAIVIGSVFKSGKNYYSQTFLEECKESKSFVADDLESSSDGDSEKEEEKEEEDFEENSINL